MTTGNIRLLSLDGGGVRGLSSLILLGSLMRSINPDAPPKPCDYFHLIGGTSTGGLIAIMLGRLKMSVEDCIKAYEALSDEVFEKANHRFKINGQLRGRFDSQKLEQAVKRVIIDRGVEENALLKDLDASCKVFVCAASKETAGSVCLTSYRSKRSSHSDLLECTTIWQACRATSAATTFFDPITVGPLGEEFVDGALGANNPVYEVWSQAQDIWGEQALNSNLSCLLSLGTGVSTIKPIQDTVVGIPATLKKLAIETEHTAEQFHRDKAYLDEEGRYFRFNVSHGLEHIGLEESKKKKDIAAATRRYLESQTVYRQIQQFSGSQQRRSANDQDRFKTESGLRNIPTSHKFVDRPADMADIEKIIIHPLERQVSQRHVCVLHGLGGVGKTQLAAAFVRHFQTEFSSIFWLNGSSEQTLRKDLAGWMEWIPKDQVPVRSRNLAIAGESDLNVVVQDVLGWLAIAQNNRWLLVFDNVDQDYDGRHETGAFDIRKYLPGDHGSVLITTRLNGLARRIGGVSKEVKKVDTEVAHSIFSTWLEDKSKFLDGDTAELLTLLDGLPLALAQAASFIQETGTDVSTYLSFYKKQWDDLMENDDGLFQTGDHEQRSIATTWRISFEAVQARSSDAANLIRLWAFADNNNVSHDFIRITADYPTWPEWLREMGRDKLKFLKAVRLLLRYSLLQNSDAESASYTIHPVVHRWSVHMQNSAERQYFLEHSLMLVGCAIPMPYAENHWVLQQQLCPHADRCMWAIEAVSGISMLQLSKNLAITFHWIGFLYENRGHLEHTDKLYKLCVDAHELALGADHKSTLTMIDNFGIFYARQGRLNEAKVLHQKAIEGFQRTLGPNHVSSFKSLYNLANVYERAGLSTEAEEMLIRVKRESETYLGPAHRLTLQMIQGLAALCVRRGHLEEAEKLFEKALKGQEADFGTGHPYTLSAVDSMGVCYREQGRLREAEAMFNRALQGREKTHGPFHRLTSASLINLAITYASQERPEEAEKAYARALEGLDIEGSDDIQTLQAIREHGGLFFEFGYWDYSAATLVRKIKERRILVETKPEMTPKQTLAIADQSL